MSLLKLLALDDEDLTVISAAMQDAVLRVEDLEFDKRNNQFLLTANRFAWEKRKGFLKKEHERRRTVLAFKRVSNVKMRGFNASDDDEVLSLLALRFLETDEGPEGELELVMSGNAGILLNVECIEVQLTDTGGAWGTRFKPKH
ncbi:MULTISPECIES: DUF2948 family protein [unclassified Lentilitoribacter]|jgi:hypothetical protein|uniref:DUF2948 family protein n=1 Tax=unclassified Lentilitoribacter TaxID=2647570 RepID=UPI0013A6B91A|nr:DUF2948 family protein [Lentilitoribacter sp. Alg239-R112]